MARSKDTVLAVDKTVEYLRKPRSTACKLAHDGKIPEQKVGRHYRFHRAVVDRWLCDSQQANRQVE